MTNAQIGERFGINERTVRKIVSGETPGTRIFQQRMPAAKVKGASPNIFRADIRIGYDPDGEEVIKSINVKVPDVQGPRGPRAPTFFDILRLPDMQNVAKIERDKMIQRYGEQIVNPDTDCDRSYCRHAISDHSLQTRACLLCRCPRYQAPDVAIISLRNIVKRDPTKILHTIRGSYGVA